MTEISALILSLIGCAVAFILQFVIWRVRVPERQTQVIVRLFVLIFAIELIGVAVFSPTFLAFTLPFSGFIYAAFSFLILLLCYVITYTAVEADSPTMIIMDRATVAGKVGVDRRSLDEELTDDALVWNRVEDLVVDGMIRNVESTYRLTDKGKALVRIFIFQRRLLRLEKGG